VVRRGAAALRLGLAVCLLAATYEQVYETARALLPSEKAFGANAIRVYGIEAA